MLRAAQLPLEARARDLELVVFARHYSLVFIKRSGENARDLGDRVKVQPARPVDGYEQLTASNFEIVEIDVQRSTRRSEQSLQLIGLLVHVTSRRHVLLLISKISSGHRYPPLQIQERGPQPTPLSQPSATTTSPR